MINYNRKDNNMKKVAKIFIITILTILSIYVLFVAEESIRLQNGGKSPIIILDGTCDGDKMEHLSNYETNCHSIGFRIKRKYVLNNNSSEDNRMFNLIQEEFWLFDKYLIWGWIS